MWKIDGHGLTLTKFQFHFQFEYFSSVFLETLYLLANEYNVIAIWEIDDSKQGGWNVPNQRNNYHFGNDSHDSHDIVVYPSADYDYNILLLFNLYDLNFTNVIRWVGTFWISCMQRRHSVSNYYGLANICLGMF